MNLALPYHYNADIKSQVSKKTDGMGPGRKAGGGDGGGASLPSKERGRVVYHDHKKSSLNFL